jgi:hypothetical protein
MGVGAAASRARIVRAQRERSPARLETEPRRPSGDPETPRSAGGGLWRRRRRMGRREECGCAASRRARGRRRGGRCFCSGPRPPPLTPLTLPPLQVCGPPGMMVAVSGNKAPDYSQARPGGCGRDTRCRGGSAPQPGESEEVGVGGGVGCCAGTRAAHCDVCNWREGRGKGGRGCGRHACCGPAVWRGPPALARPRPACPAHAPHAPAALPSMAQGEVSGLLKELGFDSSNVYKF